MTDPTLQLLVDAAVLPLSRRILEVRVDDRWQTTHDVLFIELDFRRWPFWGRSRLRQQVANAVGALGITGRLLENATGGASVAICVLRRSGVSANEKDNIAAWHMMCRLGGP